MIKLKDLIFEKMTKSTDCNCGCGTCNGAPVLKENTEVSNNLQYHVDNKIPLNENIFRPGSLSNLKVLHEARNLYDKNLLELKGNDKDIFNETDLGKFDYWSGILVPLDFPFSNEILMEVEHKGKKVQLNKPKRGGTKKFYVYVKDPKTKRIKKVSFGDTTGLKAKINNSQARQAFSKRHDCPNKKDKTKASYWSCRLPRYAKLLGLKTTFSGYW